MRSKVEIFLEVNTIHRTWLSWSGSVCCVQKSLIFLYDIVVQDSSHPPPPKKEKKKKNNIYPVLPFIYYIDII